jgi:hypothetical protein
MAGPCVTDTCSITLTTVGAPLALQANANIQTPQSVGGAVVGGECLNALRCNTTGLFVPEHRTISDNIGAPYITNFVQSSKPVSGASPFIIGAGDNNCYNATYGQITITNPSCRTLRGMIVATASATIQVENGAYAKCDFMSNFAANPGAIPPTLTGIAGVNDCPQVGERYSGSGGIWFPGVPTTTTSCVLATSSFIDTPTIDLAPGATITYYSRLVLSNETRVLGPSIGTVYMTSATMLLKFIGSTDDR